MKRFIFSVCGTLLAGACWWSGVASASQGAGDLASQTHAIFAAKCAGCHSANLVKPRGRFGYVLDLARVAANPEMVVPSSPDESEIWELVRRGEMPPADAPTGPLSNEQKELIRAWIAAGAPANSPRSATPKPDTACRSGGASTTAKGELRQRVSLQEERR
jgi:mono/diheme cytochrome c family protein